MLRKKFQLCFRCRQKSIFEKCRFAVTIHSKSLPPVHLSYQEKNLRMAIYPCLELGSGLVLFVKIMLILFQGEWQQIDSKNIYNHYYGIGFGYWMCIKAAWSWPIVRYSFPDENCFQVEIKESPNSLPSLNF